MTLADKPALFNLKCFGRVVSHFLNYVFQADLSEPVELKHGHQAVLNQWPTRGSIKIGILFFFQCVWCVVSSNDINMIVQYRVQDSLLIGGRLDGRVPFDQCSNAFAF